MSWPLCEARGCLILAPAGPLVHWGVLLASLYRTGDVRAWYCQSTLLTPDPGGMLPDEIERFLETLPPLPAVQQQRRQRGLFDDADF